MAGGSSTPNSRLKTVDRYRKAVKLYRSPRLSCSEISRTCGVSLSGVKGHIREYDRHLILAQYNSPCDKEAIEAYDSMDYIEYNISQIARCFGLDDTNLSKQLRTHYPRVIKRHEKVRKRLGLSDNLPHARGNSARSGMPGPKGCYAGIATSRSAKPLGAAIYPTGAASVVLPQRAYGQAY